MKLPYILPMLLISKLIPASVRHIFTQFAQYRIKYGNDQPKELSMDASDSVYGYQLYYTPHYNPARFKLAGFFFIMQ